MKKSYINIKTLVSLAFAGLLISSCQKKLDEAFPNPNATVRVPVETLLPGIISNIGGSSAAAGSAYGTQNDGLYIGRYVQFWATNTSGNAFDQMAGAGVPGTNVDLFGSIWAMHYYGMGQNLKRMMDWAAEEKKWDYVGVGQALSAWSWLTTAEMYGDIIVREAFRADQLVFKYDEQSLVYDTVRQICRTAITYLNNTGDNSSPSNLAIGDAYFYNGDVNKWKKFVYAVMARSFHHLSNKASYNADSVIFYSNLAMNVNADNATMRFSNTGITGTSNFFGPVRNNVNALRQTEYIANLMTGANSRFLGAVDPRAAYIIRENPNGNYRGIRPNGGASGLVVADQPANFWGSIFTSTAAPTSDADCRYIFKNGSPFPIITASEIKFMIAEAQYRKGNKAAARTAYIDGIRLSFDLLMNNYGSSVPAAKVITDVDRDAYLANPIVVPAANDLTLSHIMLQKYIALYGHGIQETWTDMRRFHYTDVEAGQTTPVYADLVLPSGINLYINNNGKLPYRARPRFNSEYLYNVSELTRLGALAIDYHTVEQWFSKP
ncbi:SusD/RagB family nutrient-binding outer membrane lipoprotein [Sediminibacterium sp.]|uniref:SusD/RagB family nutrient-binding outer membrane lipoprotein n=1 Tax=Sediminibacterium sp. TaxID=1917865 RepID=UPI002728F01A|nr:SusD/RagB family nutrient-binding outer membrane lipoprotein [Sediminibacterium sp.]MDO9156207.1 SusD/RagB family nutrient-binding outer membrane lipoprotein [Sediminibacterium sp.]MDP2421746.1 SusD/RagB family nutrient-binding outer membrane lipoprotein [Sediminibacterium sp.]